MQKLRMLIVDDEKIEREGICSLLQRNHYIFDYLKAPNGRNALKMFEKMQPEIVVTDVKMPFMDGTELARRIRMMSKSAKILIISAYGDFDYAQKAIEYDVSGYLLKPIVENDLIKQINLILEQINQDVEQKKMAMYRCERGWYEIIKGKQCDKSIDELLSVYRYDYKTSHPILMLLTFKDEILEKNSDDIEDTLRLYTDGIWALDATHLIVLVACKDELSDIIIAEMSSKIDDAMYSISNEHIGIFYYQPVNGISGLKNAWKYINEHYLFIRYKERCITNIRDRKITKNREEIIVFKPILERCMSKDVEKYEIPVLMKELSTYICTLSDDWIKYIRLIVFQAIQIINEYSKTNEDYFELYEKIENATSRNEIIDELQNRMKVMEENEDSKGYNDVVDNLLKTICEHYAEPLSLETLSQSVYLTPTYVSSLFKQRTGMNLMKYVNEYRLKKSIELLKHTNQSITEIAMNVGFNSTSYFGLVFKTYYGITPAQYRKNHS